MKLEFSLQIFEKYSIIKLDENPSSGSRVVACGRMDSQTDTTKLNSRFFAISRTRVNITHITSRF